MDVYFLLHTVYLPFISLAVVVVMLLMRLLGTKPGRTVLHPLRDSHPLQHFAFIYTAGKQGWHVEIPEISKFSVIGRLLTSEWD